MSDLAMASRIYDILKLKDQLGMGYGGEEGGAWIGDHAGHRRAALLGWKHRKGMGEGRLRKRRKRRAGDGEGVFVGGVPVAGVRAGMMYDDDMFGYGDGEGYFGGRRVANPKRRKAALANPWVKEVKKYAAEHNISYKDALQALAGTKPKKTRKRLTYLQKAEECRDKGKKVKAIKGYTFKKGPRKGISILPYDKCV